MRFPELWMHQHDLSVCALPALFQSIALMLAEGQQQVQVHFSTNDCHWIVTIRCITGAREGQATKNLKSMGTCDNVERVWFFAQQVKYGCVCGRQDFRHFLSLLNSFLFFFFPKMSTYSFYIPTLQRKLMLCRNARLFITSSQPKINSKTRSNEMCHESAAFTLLTIEQI